MRFEWDEAKRLSNLGKHGIDFVDAQELFDGRPIYTAPGRGVDEERHVITGMIDDQFLTVIWTWRRNGIRLISARRARDGERRAYRELHGG